MVKVNVLTLDSELLCSVEIEPGCTGRQLKEAIEEATEWMDLVCTQTLVLGVNTILDDEVLAFADDTVVTMTRQPAPGKIFQLPSRESPEAQRKSLALAMRRFAQSPVVLEAPFYACVYGNGQEEAMAAIYKKHSEELALQEPDRDMTFKHQALDFAVFQSALPWERMAGVTAHDVAAVLALQSSCMIIGDGHSKASAVLLLTDGRLLALTSFIDEASSLVQFDSIIVSGVYYAETCEELFHKLPSFGEAMSAPMTSDWLKSEGWHNIPIEPPWSLRMTVGELLMLEPDDSAFNFARCGLGNMPARRFVPSMPEDIRQVLVELCDFWVKEADATEKVVETCQGGEGRGNQCTFAEASAAFRRTLTEAVKSIKLQHTKATPSEIVEPYLKKLEEGVPPESLEYDFRDLVRECFHSLGKDVAFGPGKTLLER